MISLVDGLAAALRPAFAGEPARARPLATELAARVGDPDDPEASLRWSPGGFRAGRMMIERSNAETARALASGLGLDWTSEAERLCRVVTPLQLPLIIGWDARPSGVIYKLYANASDRALEVRKKMRDELEIESDEVPHVVGLNVSRNQSDLKLYFQRRSAPEVGIPAPALSDAAIAGWVLACDFQQRAIAPRALFVAICEGHDPEIERLVEAITGTRWAQIAQMFPFEPGPIRQIGWSLDGSVTFYAKAKGARAIHTLEPVAVFASKDAEVGLYLEPSESTARAFARTGRLALSFRTRLGEPSAGALERLGAWAKARLANAETLGEAPGFDSPPEPWVRISS